jgi:hypothetical protein
MRFDMASRRLDLYAVLALVALGGLVIWLWPGESALRSILGILLVLALPGYAVEAALFEPGSLAAPVRLLMIIGLSLAVAVLGGLALNWSPLGLQTGTWYGWSAGITCSACLVGMARFPQAARGQDRALSPIQLRPLVLVSAALLIAGTAMVVSRLPAPPDNAVGYTQLSMVRVLDGVQPVVRIQISSSEFSLVHYRLQVVLDGRSFMDIPDIPIAPGGQWERVVELPVSLAPNTAEVMLYRLDDPGTVYRHVKLLLDPARK